MKQVRETSAGKSISAFVVLNKKGDHVATVQAHYSNSGVVTVDVWNLGEEEQMACLMVARRTGFLSDRELDALVDRAPEYYLERGDREAWAASERYNLQQSQASGYGYDKFTAALAGLIIDGHTLADHCGKVPECESARVRLLKAHQKKAGAGVDGSRADKVKADKIGARFANWDASRSCYSSLYFEPGLDRLERLGYRVIRAI